MSDENQPVNQPPAAAPPYTPPYTPAYGAAPASRSGRGGLLLAGLVLAVTLVAGTAGFALGHVTTDDGRDGPMRPFNGNGQPPNGFGQGPPTTR